MLKHPPLRLLAISFVLILHGCGTGGYDSDEGQQEEEEVTPTEPVPADSILEAVTWNLNWYGDGTYGSGSGNNGPRNEQQQTENFVQVLDSLQADLYAFQEVYSGEALSDITGRLGGYEGFVADHINQMQKTAFVYNTNTIDSLEAGGITAENGQDDNAWASGRFPLYFHFLYSYEGETREFYAVVIHAKAFDDEESYERRRDAAEDLYDYLQQNHPEANILLLGDYNDDVDVSIYAGAESPYQPFKETLDFRILTQILSEVDSSSTTNNEYPDMIDHITVSDELYPLYIEESASVFTAPESFIPYYSNTTTDHYPVWAKFDVTP